MNQYEREAFHMFLARNVNRPDTIREFDSPTLQAAWEVWSACRDNQPDPTLAACMGIGAREAIKDKHGKGTLGCNEVDPEDVIRLVMQHAPALQRAIRQRIETGMTRATMDAAKGFAYLLASRIIEGRFLNTEAMVERIALHLAEPNATQPSGSFV